MTAVAVELPPEEVTVIVFASETSPELQVEGEIATTLITVKRSDVDDVMTEALNSYSSAKSVNEQDPPDAPAIETDFAAGDVPGVAIVIP